MDIPDIDKLQRAQRRLLRDLRDRMQLRPDLASEQRAALIARYKAELRELQQEKERSARRFDEEIRHYEELISRAEKGVDHPSEETGKPTKRS